MMELFAILAFLVGYTYLIYPVVLAVFGLIKDKCQGVKVSRCQRVLEAQPSVSMVVAAYNEEECIREKIENFLALEYPCERIELIIGSDGSTDKTVSLIRPLLSGRVRLREFDRRRGKAAVLNEIADEARGEILLFSEPE